MKELSGWGRNPVIRAHERLTEDLEVSSENAVLARGLGRSYGDASLPPDEGLTVVGTALADRILSFDSKTGVLRAEAGFSLLQMNRVFAARGWSSPVHTGTQYVTLGGMVASDVHGKNHHVAGCFGEHVRALRIRVADGRILEISDQQERELFRATLGGMGLTGHILEVEVQLEAIASPWIYSEAVPVRNLDELVAELRKASKRWPYTMSWIDSTAKGDKLGRGVLINGRWATAEEARSKPPEFGERVGVPFFLPSWVVAPWSIRIFNGLYYHLQARTAGTGIVHPQSFFYPLDAIRDWNRFYGRKGMAQYQCVLPLEEGDHRPVHRLFDALTRHGGASPVSVIKDCGEQGRGALSFPRRGISIALDLPWQGARTQATVDALNEVVIEAGGRIYLTKDALTRPEHFRAMEPRLDAWQAVRRKWDPEGRIRSAQAERLLGIPK